MHAAGGDPQPTRLSMSTPESTAFPLSLRRFVELFRAGRFWDSHEVLEDRWRDTGSDFLQGLILYASAWVHWERRNAHGVRAQLRKARTRLSGYPDDYLGLDVQAIREHCATVRREVAADPDGWPERVAPLPLTLAHERLRGDEAELAGR
jgi:predicted metal-dependent hydrolase